MVRTYKYESGKKAKKKFERAMIALFKAPKTVRVGQASKKASSGKTSRKSEREGKGE